MKTFIVFSDLHGDYSSLKKISQFASKNQGAIFAGDGGDVLADFKDQNWYTVKGNCDQIGKDEMVFEQEGVKIFLTHGHLYGVKSSYLRILMRAKELGCGVVVFGHTHQPMICEEDGVLMVNPGSCSYYASPKTYACLVLSNGKASAYLNQLK